MVEKIKEGDMVREQAWRVPKGCVPFVGRARSIAPDGWVCVEMGERTLSFAPNEVEKITDDGDGESEGRAPDSILADFDLGCSGTASDVDMRAVLWEVIQDVVDSFDRACRAAGAEHQIVTAARREVEDYLINHYGDE